MGTQEPQVVPALVQSLILPTVSQPPSTTASVMAPLLTVLHEQISASSGSASTPIPPPPPDGASSAAGVAGSERPTMGRSVA